MTLQNIRHKHYDKQSTMLMCIACLALITGCQNGPYHHEPPDPWRHAEINAALVQVMNRSSIDAAIVSQHALYPYHFFTHSARLNELGSRDLAILVEHYRAFGSPQAPLSLNVRRGAVAEELYEQRIQAVVQTIADAGIRTADIEIQDGMPGGDGVATERVVKILAAERQAGERGRTRHTPVSTSMSPNIGGTR